MIHFTFRESREFKQRRKWHPTQLNEGLVERCLLLTAKEGDHILDLFSGTGTVARVASRLKMSATLIEKSEFYYKKLLEEFGGVLSHGLARRVTAGHGTRVGRCFGPWSGF